LHPSALRSVAAEAGPVSRGVGQHHDERRFNPATRRITNLKEISRRTVRTGAPVAIEGRKRETLGGKVYTQESRKCPKHSHDVHSPPAKTMNSVTVDIFTDVQFPIHVAVTCKIQWLLFFSYAQRCISYDRFGLSVCLSVCHSPVSCHNDSSYDHAVFTEDSSLTLVSSRLTSLRNSKENTGSESAKRERGRR